MQTKHAPAHWLQCQLFLTSDLSQRWNMGEEARESQQGYRAWGLEYSWKTPQAGGTEDEAGHPTQGKARNSKVKFL